LKFLASLLIYIGSFGLWGWATYGAIKFNWIKRSKHFLVGLTLVWLGLIFNIVYTGLLGWNFTPASDLESVLDGVTFMIQTFGIVLIYIGIYKIYKK
jgi:hypothetical protein